MRRWIMASWLLLVVLTSCGTPAQANNQAQQSQRLRLATTTSTADSGLLDAILPDFERLHRAEVEVIAVGTGQALTLGQNGDVDVVLVHDQPREDQFIAEGFGIDRRDVMYNDFVIVGPPPDPAAVKQATSGSEAVQRIAAAAGGFVSRGDASGTYAKEASLWQGVGIDPQGQDWYKSMGQGMGETLLAANELEHYTISDRGTYLAVRDKLPRLALLFGGATVGDNPDPALRNPYGVIAVNPTKHAAVNGPLATAFMDWLTSPDVQAQIGAFGTERFGQSLFYPATK